MMRLQLENQQRNGLATGPSRPQALLSAASAHLGPRPALPLANGLPAGSGGLLPGMSSAQMSAEQMAGLLQGHAAKGPRSDLAQLLQLQQLQVRYISLPQGLHHHSGICPVRVFARTLLTPMLLGCKFVVCCLSHLLQPQLHFKHGLHHQPCIMQALFLQGRCHT